MELKLVIELPDGNLETHLKKADFRRLHFF
jgi:hypothetical protein